MNSRSWIEVRSCLSLVVGYLWDSYRIHIRLWLYLGYLRMNLVVLENKWKTRQNQFTWTWLIYRRRWDEDRVASCCQAVIKCSDVNLSPSIVICENYIGRFWGWKIQPERKKWECAHGYSQTRNESYMVWFDGSVVDQMLLDEIQVYVL